MMKRWNEKLEKIFETNNQDLSLLESQKTFELNADNSSLEHLSYIYSFLLEKNNIHSVFTQLSPFFEVGFLFERQKTINCVINAFAFGQPVDLAQKTLVLKLPQAALFNIVKISAAAVFKKLNYGFLDSPKKMQSYTIGVSDTYSIMIATDMAEPWIKNRLEALQKTLMKIHFE